MKDEYLTTTEAATMCHVTRFTIANWEKNGKLKTNKTAGGHRRILRKNLVSFIKTNRIVEVEKKDTEVTVDRAKDTGCRIPYCWEFRFKSPEKHNCVSCLVFKERANKCFLINREFGSGDVQCQEECSACEYLNTYYPAKRKIIEKSKTDMINRIQALLHKQGEETSTFFKKGLYISGKYIGSIEKAIFQKKKKRMNAL